MARVTALLLIALGLLAGCGGGGDEPSAPADGDSPEAQQFAQTCGSCHTFGPAGTEGAVGPPLDGTELDAAAISRQIDQGGNSMPPDLVTGEERERLARWIADNAAP